MTDDKWVRVADLEPVEQIEPDYDSPAWKTSPMEEEPAPDLPRYRIVYRNLGSRQHTAWQCGTKEDATEDREWVNKTHGMTGGRIQWE